MATLPAIEPLRVPNPLEGYAQVEQILGARQQREANALAMQQRQQALEAEEQIRRYQAGGGDPRGLLRFGAAGVKAFGDLTQAEERYAKNVQDRLAIGRELMLRAPDAQSLARAVRSQFDDPVLGPTLAGMRLNADQMVEHVLKNSTTPSGFNEMRLLYGQGAENLAKFIQEKIAEHQVAAALGGGAPGAPAGAPAAPAAPTAAAAPAGTAVATPFPDTSAVWAELERQGIAAPAPAAGAALGGPTIQRLQSAALPAPPSLNAMAPAAPVAPANALVAQAGGVVGTPAAGGIDISAIDPYAQRRDQLESRLQQTFNKDARAAIIAELNALPKPAAGIQKYLAYVRQEERAGRKPLGIEQYEQNLARAGASSVEVKLPPQEKAFQTALGTGQAKKLLEDKAVADDAKEIISTVQQGRQLLQSGMITGFGAEFLTQLGAALNQAGINFAEDRVANTQAFAANMAQNVGRIIKQFGAGTGLSNDDRIYATKMAGGQITLDRAAIEKILDINERAARNVIKLHNERVKGIETNIPLTVEMPTVQAPPPPAGAASRPPLQQIFGR